MGDVTKVMEGGLVATLHLPTVTGRRPAVIVLGGSDGGLAGANLFGEPIAASGFVALCLAYFAMDGLPADLSEIPLEYFQQAIDWLRGHRAVDGERLAVLGSSRGGEAALLIGASFPAIRAVVANVPSHVVWQGINSDPSMKTSSWSFAGVGLPFVSLVTPRVGTSWREWFEVSLIQHSPPADAAIPVERINGPILFITGTEDGIWPCSKMVDLATERLGRHRFRFYIKHARYEGGGHAILVPPYRVGPVENPWPHESYRQPHWMRSGLTGLALGGTAEGNRLARMDAWPRMVAFLKQHLAPP
jgi:dienelactone hydrolase